MANWEAISPIFYGYKAISTGDVDNVSAAIVHPACTGFKLEEEKEPCRDEDTEIFKPQAKEKGSKQCSAKVYLEKEIFPVLLPALDEMLRAAIDNDVLKWKRTKFNGCDYLTEYLYNNNPHHNERQKTDLWDIPFVQRINSEKPRPPLPLSLLLTDEEAAVIIQSFWRGCMVRMDEEVQELRKYQKEMREQEYDIMLKIEDFWKKHPVEEESDEAAT